MYSTVDHWAKFDSRVLMTCPSHKDRLPSALAELERVGLGGSTEVSCDPEALPSYANLARHFRRVLEAFVASRAERLLVMEDDVRFLTDVGRLHAAVERLPDDADVAYLAYGNFPKLVSRTEPWSLVNSLRWTREWSNAAFSYNRRAALDWLGTDSPELSSGPGFLNVDLRTPLMVKADPGLRVYMSIPMLAITDPKAPGAVAGNAAAALRRMANTAARAGLDVSHYGPGGAHGVP